MVRGFKEFLLRGNVIDLAVAVVVGAAFTGIVNAMVKDILTPIVAAIFGQPDFSNLTFTINRSKFLYGDFLNAVLSFLFIASAIYFLIVVPLKKVSELQARRRTTGQLVDEAVPVSDEVVLLGEIRDLLRTQS